MYTIYALADPATDEIRYVGKTKRPIADRYSDHLEEGRMNDGTPRGEWIKSLIDQGIAPRLIVLESVEGRKEGNDIEKREIARCREAGYALVNVTAGGDGGYTRTGPMTDEHKAKIGAANRKHGGARKSASHKRREFDQSIRDSLLASIH
jgi:hypothetical protein